jgi:hypothetical protein
MPNQINFFGRLLLPIAIAGALTVGLHLGWKHASPNEPADAVERAKSADSFIDTIGISVHGYYIDTAYGNFDGIVKPRLFELGIRHVRDGALTVGYNYNSPYYQHCRTLAARGIKFNLATSIKSGWGGDTDFSMLKDVYKWCNGAVVSFEGINEPDLLPGVPDWIAATRAAQKQLYKTVKRHPALASVAVIGPSPTSIAAVTALGDLSSDLDYGNMHPYPGGRNPETPGWGGPFKCGSQQFIYGSLAYNLFCIARPLSPSKPIIATETGWNYSNQTQIRTPGKIVSRYLPRLFLYYFNQGIARSYLYELLDLRADPNDPEANFGLLRSDGTPKAAFVALKNLIRLLKDPGPKFQPAGVTYSLSGKTTEVQHTLLQKRNGDFYLALWLGLSAWDPGPKTEISIPAQPLTLTLPSSGNATVYTFNDEGSVSFRIVTIKAKKVSLSVTDRVTFVKFRSR